MPEHKGVQLAKLLVRTACEFDPTMTDGEVGSSLGSAFVAYARGCGLTDQQMLTCVAAAQRCIPSVDAHEMGQFMSAGRGRVN